MTPGQSVNLVRNGVVHYTARVMRLAPFGDAILDDVRRLDGVAVKPTGGTVSELRIRIKVKTGNVSSLAGFGGELRAIVQEVSK
jgi:hypothetical protein